MHLTRANGFSELKKKGGGWGGGRGSEKVRLVLYVTPVYQTSVYSSGLTKILWNFYMEGSDQIVLPLKECNFSIIFTLNAQNQFLFEGRNGN